MELCGTQASIVIEEDSIVSAEGLDINCSTGSGYKSFSDPTAITTELHEAQFRNILAAVVGEETLYYTSAEAMQTVAVILAIYESSLSATQQTLV